MPRIIRDADGNVTGSANYEPGGCLSGCLATIIFVVLVIIIIGAISGLAHG